MTQELTMGCFTNIGKQVLANGVHYADFADDNAAAFATAALNKHGHEGNAERDSLRKALIEMGRMLPGVLLADEVSSRFLADWLPGELRAHLDALARVPTEERVA